MKTTLSSYDFVNAFSRAYRETQFSRSARFALFDYLDQVEQDTGEEIELDVISLCCDFTEYATALEGAMAYEFLPDADESEEKQEQDALGYLRENTQVITFSGGIIVQNY